LFGQLTGDQTTFLVILAVSFTLLLTEWLRNDVVALMIILALYATGLLDAREALSGFASEPAVVVAGIFVLSGALYKTGVSDGVGRWIGRLAGRSYTRMIGVIMPSVAVLSAFTHHLTTTAVMLPVSLNLARDARMAPSKLLMPLAFAASLGTTIAIIGAPAFLIASAALSQAGRPGLSLFSIAPIGLTLTVTGTLFVLLFGRFLLPTRRAAEDPSARFRLDDYFTELTIREDSPLLDKTVSEVEADERYAFKVVGWLRDGRRIHRMHGGNTLRAGDVLLVRTTPDQIVAFREHPGLELHPVEQYGQELPAPNGDDERELAETLSQAVVAPGSELVGKTLGQIDFRQRYRAIVLGIWRRHGWLGEEMAHLKLQSGDVLVLQGDDDALKRVQNDPAFLMIVPFVGESRLHNKAPLAAMIMAGTVLLTVFDVLSIEMAAMAGGLAMVLTRCITARQAYDSIDARIYVFIAGALPLGAAMKKTGTADLLANAIKSGVAGWDLLFILLALFTVVAIITQFMSDAATTALFAPVAIALAHTLGHRPEPFVVTVAMAAVASFLTPIGHHGNLLVYAPGGYHFNDFVKVGTPLTVLVALIVVSLSPMLWPG
jgi:di/tricarboxylate transporter